MRASLIALVLAGGSLCAGEASAQDLGDARMGLEYAKKTCAGCHAILLDDIASPNPDSPPFKIVADTPGITATALAVFLQTPHKTMPNLLVEGEDKDNVIAYILSLKGEATDAPQ